MNTTPSVSANLYPFVSKATIKARMESDAEFRKQVIVMLFQKQTAHEQDTKTTLKKNRVGFMSSHSVHGTTIARKILAGEVLTLEEMGHVDSIAPRYSRQIALFMRQDAIAANPELAKVATTFSAG